LYGRWNFCGPTTSRPRLVIQTGCGATIMTVTLRPYLISILLAQIHYVACDMTWSREEFVRRRFGELIRLTYIPASQLPRRYLHPRGISDPERLPEPVSSAL